VRAERRLLQEGPGAWGRHGWATQTSGAVGVHKRLKVPQAPEARGASLLLPSSPKTSRAGSGLESSELSGRGTEGLSNSRTFYSLEAKGICKPCSHKLTLIVF